MKVWRLLLVLLVILGTYSAAPRAWACSCVPGSTREERYQEDWDAIFVGTVLRVRDLDRSDEQGEIEASFRVDRVNKGTAYRRDRVRTAENGGLCGVPFKEGQEWQVWASRRKGILHTGLCAPNSNISRGGAPYEPRSYAPLTRARDLPATGHPSPDPSMLLVLAAGLGIRLARRPDRTT